MTLRPRFPVVRRSARRYIREQHGFVAGSEALIFGVLLFVGGSLVLLNAWRVIDARFAVSTAARAATHAAVVAPLDSAPEVRGRDAGIAAFEAAGYDRDQLELTVEAPVALERCREVRFNAVAEVEPVGAPAFGWVHPIRVSASHTQVVDAHRSGLPSGLHCPW